MSISFTGYATKYSYRKRVELENRSRPQKKDVTAVATDSSKGGGQFGGFLYSYSRSFDCRLR